VADWLAVETERDRLVLETVDEPFERGTIENARQLVVLGRDHCPVPDVGKGYWSTFRFTWGTTPPIEVEVFRDHFEFYCFHDDRPDIVEIAHVAGDALPAELVARLPSTV